MQIRTLILLLTLISSCVTALVVWTIGEQKENLQIRSDSEVRRNIYLGIYSSALRSLNEFAGFPSVPLWSKPQAQ